MSDLSKMSVEELVGLHANIMQALRRRGVPRSGANLTAELARFLFCSAYGWQPMPPWERGCSAVSAEGERVLIRGRRLHPRSRSRQLSVIRDIGELDVLAAVLVDDGYRVLRGAVIPHAVVLGGAVSSGGRTASGVQPDQRRVARRPGGGRYRTAARGRVERLKLAAPGNRLGCRALRFLTKKLDHLGRGRFKTLFQFRSYFYYGKRSRLSCVNFRALRLPDLVVLLRVGYVIRKRCALNRLANILHAAIESHHAVPPNSSQLAN